MVRWPHKPGVHGIGASSLLDHIRDGAAKFRDSKAPEEVGITCIDTDLRDMEATHKVLSAEVAADHHAHRATDAIVVRLRDWHHPPHEDPQHTYQQFYAFVFRLPWSPASEHELATIACPILASQHRLIAPVRRRGVADVIPTAATGMKVLSTTL